MSMACIEEKTTDLDRRVLIIDDDHDFADGLADVLGIHACETQCVYSSVEARTLCAKGNVLNVVLIDLRLGNDSGLELIEPLRKANPEVLCILMTAHAALDTAIKGLQKGAYDYLNKPINVVDLLSTLDRCFETISLRKRSAAAESDLLRRNAELERLNARLRDSEARFSGTVEQAREAIVSIDARERIILFNESASRTFGHSPEEVLGKSIETLLPERFRAGHSKIIQDFSASGRKSIPLGARGEVFGLRKDGSEFPAEASVSKLAIGGDTIFTVILRDITERKKAEANLAHSEEQLRQAQKMEAVGRLAGGVAHDFNNLLMAINGHADLILEDLSVEDDLYDDIREIAKAGERAADLTGQLLALSRKQVLQVRSMNLNSTVANMKKMLRRLIGEHIELRTVEKAPLALVKADPGQIEQVIMNLVLNARDAINRTGRITIETDNVTVMANDAAGPSGLEPGAYVRLAIRDTGAGMDESVRQRVFEPFYTTKDKEKGTGLGLSTAFGIIKQSGGTIEVQSTPGSGSVFRVYLPASEHDDAEDRVEVPSAKSEAGEETILVVEDEDYLRALIKRTLKMKGYKVLVAADGLDALRLCEQRTGPIDLMVTDVVMPKMSGVDLANALAPIRPDTRVLFISGYQDDLIAEHGVANGDVNFLQKPFLSDALWKMVRAVLDAPAAK